MDSIISYFKGICNGVWHHMIYLGRFAIFWKGFKGDLFAYGFRLNSGGFMYGPEPYRYLTIGPIQFRVYLKNK